MHARSQKIEAFTLLEILVIIAILGMIFALAVTGFRNFASFQQYNQAVSDATFILNQTRSDARSAVSDESHGIKIGATSLTRFTGDTFSAVDPTNVTTDYNLVTFTTDLTGGTDEIIFNKLTGLPSATGTITVVGVAFEASTTVEITAAGVVQ